ncbi:MAG: heme lyase CcmF/NrfE family subunit [Gemmatimonadales bacterium]
MTILGQISLWLALLLAVWAVIVGFLGGKSGRPELIQSARRSVYALAAVLVVASASLLVALLRHDFNVAYVASYTSSNLPTVYTISAFYGGQAGSLLFWAVVLSLYAAVAQWLTPKKYAHLMPYVGGVTSIVALFFIVTMLFADSPFERLPFTPAEGQGLNPQLQNPGMVIHPPMLYLGYIGITIPFAFAVAALLSKQLDTGWLHAIRKWTLWSWMILGVGITLGMWWAYVELGWGGYWAWDPVENASLLPWLTMTAFLHSVMIQEKRGMLKRWNMILIVLSFMLSIFGTFITRSGIISSVHSFTQSSVGYFFLVFLILSAIGLTWLLVSRLPLLAPESKLESMVSREASFLFNNLILVGMAFSILWGTLFPILSEWVKGTKVAVGAPFFNQVNIPLGLLLLVLTGIGPVIAWRKASVRNLRRQFVAPVALGVITGAILVVLRFDDFYSGVAVSFGVFVVVAISQEFWRGAGARHRLHGENYPLAFARLIARNRRRYGGYVVHLAIVTYFVAFTGMAFKTEIETSLRPGESATLRSPFGHTYTFTHIGISQYDAANRFVTAASVEVRKNGERVGVMRSERRQYFTASGLGRQSSFQPATEAGIASGLKEDLYIVFGGSVGGTEEAVYRFTINPLVWWVWFGGLMLVVGGTVVMWPSSRLAIAHARPVAGYRAALVGIEV